MLKANNLIPQNKRKHLPFVIPNNKDDTVPLPLNYLPTADTEARLC